MYSEELLVLNQRASEASFFLLVLSSMIPSFSALPNSE